MGKLGQNRRFGVLKRWIPCFLFLVFVTNANAEWVSVVPPEVSADWGLSKGRVLPSGDGWAVGNNFADKKGVILRLRETN